MGFAEFRPAAAAARRASGYHPGVLDNPQRLFLDVDRSWLGRPWRPRLDLAGEARALAIVQRHGLGDLLARVLVGRGVGLDEAVAHLDPTLRNLMPDPSTMRGMDEAVSRLVDAVDRREKVAVFGDYDVDGACSSALIASFLRACGLDCTIRIPDRIFEGYGPNVQAMNELAAGGATLLVTVDCGTTSHEAIAEARRLGLDVIVLDHHQAPELLPDAIVVNPNRQDDLSGLGALCAAGVAFMALVGLNRALREKGFWTKDRPAPDLLADLDLVALATVADVAPLTGLNRAFVAKGLDRDARPRPAGPVGADGRRPARRAAAGLASRLPARAAHQRRRAASATPPSARDC